MGFRRRVEKNQPFQHVAKGFALCGLVALTFACSSSQKQSAKTSLAKVLSNSASQTLTSDQITTSGENDSPTWSPDSSHLLFVSRNRSQHKNSQIYEYDIAEKKERRITYSDGDALDPIYVLGGKKIVYSSTTDEIKERPLLLERKESTNEHPSDLYLSDLQGNEIQRLTNRPGFDGDIQPSGVREDEFYFTSIEDNRRQINKFSLRSMKASLLFGDTKEIHRDFVSNFNQFAWIGVDASRSPVQILYLAQNTLKNPKPVNTTELVIQDLSWVPGEKKGDASLLISIASKEEPLLRVVMYDSKQNCFANVISEEKSQVFQARVSPDRKRIAFVSDQIQGTRQIKIRDVEWDKIKCRPVKVAKSSP